VKTPSFVVSVSGGMVTMEISHELLWQRQ